VILCEGSIVKSNDFFPGNKAPRKTDNTTDDVRTLDEMEQHFIREVLERNHGNVTKTAKELGLTRTALYRRLHKYGL
jgi:transcriptional regulator of acetoin/glycerol metabolism